MIAIQEKPVSHQPTQLPQVRLEVNHSCGKACIYCRPTGEGLPLKVYNEIPQASTKIMELDQLVEIVSVLADIGITDFKLTGGDPMLRHDIVELVRRIKLVPGVRSVHLVTRHASAGKVAKALHSAGLDLLNFSLDSCDPTIWSQITKVSGHEELLQAIYEAHEAGIPLKINTVVLRGINDHEVPELIKLAGAVKAELKLLDLIRDLPKSDAFDAEQFYCDLRSAITWLADHALKAEMIHQPGGLGHPMPRFYLPNGATVIVKTGWMGAFYSSQCASCQMFPCWDAVMALRVTPNGFLQHCLLRSDNLVNLLEKLRINGRAAALTAAGKYVDLYRKAMFYSWENLQLYRESVAYRKLAQAGLGVLGGNSE